MMFDNSRVATLPLRRSIVGHVPVIVFVLGAVGVAAGTHLGSGAVVAVAAGHLVVAALLAAASRLQNRARRGGRP